MNNNSENDSYSCSNGNHFITYYDRSDRKDSMVSNFPLILLFFFSFSLLPIKTFSIAFFSFFFFLVTYKDTTRTILTHYLNLPDQEEKVT